MTIPPDPTARSPDPAEVYRTSRDAYRSRAEEAASRADRLSSLRLTLFGLGILLGIGALLGWFSGHLLWFPFALFVGLVVLHQRADRARFVADRAASLYERGLARIEDRWSGQGLDGAAFRPEDHVYADDLDLFGPGSLFELLCTARTRAGEERLASWLARAAPPDEIRARQSAVEELRGRVDLREDLQVVGAEISSTLDRSEAVQWGEAPSRLTSRVVPWVARLLGLVTTALFAAWIFGALPALPFVVAAGVQLLVTLPWSRRVETVLQAADRPVQDLELVSRLLRRWEGEAFESPLLRDLRSGLEHEGDAPSRSIRRLVRLMDFVEARRNQIFLPISWLLALGTQLAFAIEAWRTEYGEDLVKWVDTLGTFEALMALAGYAYEHPADPFPEILDDGAVFEGRELGHPLLPAATNVRNDVSLTAPPSGGSPQALLVSGSNMSGKSTLLRTVGVNAVLALAGAPVRATSLVISSLEVGASIRVHDSLQEGESRFYAEIARLSRVVELAARDPSPPALFLLDEMLGGTNSHDRRIGAAAVIRSLLDQGAIGLVTTHDLALAEIADGDDRMENVHFEDHLEDGRMVFDYRMHPGVVTRSNAIELMRAVGLDISE